MACSCTNGTSWSDTGGGSYDNINKAATVCYIATVRKAMNRKIVENYPHRFGYAYNTGNAAATGQCTQQCPQIDWHAASTQGRGEDEEQDDSVCPDDTVPDQHGWCRYCDEMNTKDKSYCTLGGAGKCEAMSSLGPVEYSDTNDISISGTWSANWMWERGSTNCLMPGCKNRSN